MKNPIKKLVRACLSDPPQDTFISLVQLAGEDELIRSQLLTILEQPQGIREQKLAAWLADMKLEGAPGHFIDAVDRLRDPDIADALWRHLNSLAP